MNPQSHWEHVYQTKATDQVSWFQREATVSLQLIQAVAPATDAAILDVGGGASVLVDGLLAAGYQHPTVLDISAAALAIPQQRLGAASDQVTWRAEDVLSATLPEAAYDLWHDRAVFHFLHADSDRAEYLDQVRRALRPAGHLVMATFAEDGPTRCSGLDVRRYSPDALDHELGPEFRLIESRREEHTTPAGTTQAFIYGAWKFEP